MSNLHFLLGQCVGILASDELSPVQKHELMVAELGTINVALIQGELAIKALLEQREELVNAVERATATMTQALADLQDLNLYVCQLQFEIHCLRQENDKA